MPEFDHHRFPEKPEFTLWRRRPSIFAANAMYMFSVMALVVLSLLTEAISVVFPFLDVEAVGRFLTVAYEIGVLALPVVVYAFCRPGVSVSMRLNPPPVSAMCIAAATAVVGIFLTNYIELLWMIAIEQMGGRLIDSGVAIPTTKQALIFSIITIGVLPGICEELLFRGAILGAWERRGGKTGLIVSSVLFALMHGSVLGLPTHLLLGLVLGFLVIASDSIYVGMTFHTVYNSALMILAFMGGETDVGNYYDYVGGMAGVLQLVMSVIFTGVIFVALLFAAYASSRHRREFFPFKDKRRMNWRELILIFAGVITVLSAYLLDLLRICRVMP